MLRALAGGHRDGASRNEGVDQDPKPQDHTSNKRGLALPALGATQPACAAADARGGDDAVADAEAPAFDTDANGEPQLKRRRIRGKQPPRRAADEGRLAGPACNALDTPLHDLDGAAADDAAVPPRGTLRSQHACLHLLGAAALGRPPEEPT